MKRMLCAILAAGLMAAGSGCCLVDRLFHCGSCHPCHPHGYGAPAAGCDSCGGGYDGYAPAGDFYSAGVPTMPSGPPSASITYPYYTTRGPRDFLASDPRSIGR